MYAVYTGELANNMDNWGKIDKIIMLKKLPEGRY